MPGRIISFLLLLSFIVMGCGTQKPTNPTADLKNRLRQRYSGENITTVVGKSSISVTFLNSKMRSLKKNEKESKTDEILHFVIDNYRSINKIKSITITYAYTKKIVVIKTTDTSDSHTFVKKNGSWVKR